MSVPAPSARLSRVAPVALALLVLATGCGGSDGGTDAPGTALEPHLGAAHPRAAHAAATKNKKQRAHHPHPRARRAVSGRRSTAANPSPASPTSPGGGTAPVAGGSGPVAASVTDARGDVQGSAPAYLDLTGARLERIGNSYVLVVRAAAPFPTAASGDTTVNVISFYDVDGDGQADDQIWGTLADNGWSGTYRSPGHASFGSASGVSVRPVGDTLRFSFPAGHVPGQRFDWSVGAEYGTFAQVASGSTAQDYAPDTGSVSFPQ